MAEAFSTTHSPPMAVDSCGEGPAYVSVSAREGVTNLQCEPQLASLGNLEVRRLPNSKTCLDVDQNRRNYVSLEMENADAYFPCIVHTDIEKGISETPQIDDNAEQKLKIEAPLAGALQRQISLLIGEKVMQLLMNETLVLPKSTFREKPETERAQENLNRTRKYKRPASFNSRKVVLLFSLLSCVGTIVLIYLTLKSSTNW